MIVEINDKFVAVQFKDVRSGGQFRAYKCFWKKIGRFYAVKYLNTELKRKEMLVDFEEDDNVVTIHKELGKIEYAV